MLALSQKVLSRTKSEEKNSLTYEENFPTSKIFVSFFFL